MTRAAMSPRPFRVAVLRDIQVPSDLWKARAREEADWTDQPRRAEALGYHVFSVGEHLYDSPDPLIDLMATASVTSSLRLRAFVLINCWHNPALLAKRIASIDLFSGGRIEMGLGVGYNPIEYENSGIPFEPANVRIARLRESVCIIKALWESTEPVTYNGDFFTIKRLIGLPRPVQTPHPPVLIGGGGHVMLGLAGEVADIVSLIPSPLHPSGLAIHPVQWTAGAVQQKIDRIRDSAGARFPEIELDLALFKLVVTDDCEAGAKQVHAELDAAYKMHGQDGFPLSEQDLLESPYFAIGTIDEIAKRLVELRASLGTNSITITSGMMEEFAPVLEKVADVDSEGPLRI